MEATELRIGNLVLIPDNDEIIIPSIPRVIKGITFLWELDFSDITSEHKVNVRHCAGIPLTEEWLVKFGFKNGEKDNFSFTKSMELRIMGYENDYSGLWIGELHYVHQLQNLYFALTGKELTIQK